MSDLEVTWAGDLSLSSTGDLALVSNPSLGTERVLRRLMTNPGEYIWNPSYGAGLAAFVGRPVDTQVIEALIRSQIMLEAAVAPTPEPIILVTSDVVGRIFVQIRYQDSSTATGSNLTVNLPG